MKATIEGNVLKLEIPMNPPRMSASGKSKVVATTGGNVTMPNVMVDGKPVTIGVNAYIKA